MKKLLVISSSPAVPKGERYLLDVKFCEGMQLYSGTWDGSVTALMRMRSEDFPFGDTYDLADLPFDMNLLQEGADVRAEDIRGFDVVLCSGDNHAYFHVVDLCRAEGVPLVFIIENILKTRIQIALLDRSRSLARRLYSVFWQMRQELKRRRVFRRANGLQANGYPSYGVYKRINDNTLLYLDNRVDREMLADDTERSARRDHLLEGGRLRLIHSGRLEPMKGSDDLIPIAKELVRQNVDFELNIFGTGSLEDEIRADIETEGLQDRVRLHGVADFKSELVPFTRKHSDIYLSCHRQSDPSCTYIEAMGGGIPVIGYSNHMWSALCRESKAGWVAPLGQPMQLAAEIVRLNTARQEIVDACENAYSMAEKHEFHREFSRRIAHLAKIAGS